MIGKRWHRMGPTSRAASRDSSVPAGREAQVSSVSPSQSHCWDCLEQALPSAEQGLMPAEALVPAVPSSGTASTALFSWQFENINPSQMCTPDCLPGLPG